MPVGDRPEKFRRYELLARLLRSSFPFQATRAASVAALGGFNAIYGKPEERTMMSKLQNDHVFTSESVSEDHPDKVCDQVSDAILDACLAEDASTQHAAQILFARLGQGDHQARLFVVGPEERPT